MRSPDQIWALAAEVLDGPAWPAEVQTAVSVLAAEVEHSSTCSRCHVEAEMALAVDVLSGRFDLTLVDIADAVVELADELAPIGWRCTPVAASQRLNSANGLGIADDRMA